ncbi:MAG TPA: hypothetical protein VJS20_10320 [Gemmatimonadales bacterium]|nr:hypothetical protein [Gemmatimonadales bacterium]
MRLVMLALLVVSVTHCRERGGSVPSATQVVSTTTPGGLYLLVPSEAAAYRRGREREIGLLRDALTRHTALTPATSIRAGADAAGLTVDAYQLLVTRVDSALRLRSALATPDSSGPARTEWAELDSLRVELTVLRTRLEAIGSPTP